MKKTYKIWWRDATSDPQWKNPREIDEWAKRKWNAPVFSRGEIVLETDNYLVIAGSRGEDDDIWGDLTLIPKSWIIKRERIWEEKELLLAGGKLPGRGKLPPAKSRAAAAYSRRTLIKRKVVR